MPHASTLETGMHTAVSLHVPFARQANGLQRLPSVLRADAQPLRNAQGLQRCHHRRNVIGLMCAKYSQLHLSGRHALGRFRLDGRRRFHLESGRRPRKCHGRRLLRELVLQRTRESGSRRVWFSHVHCLPGIACTRACIREQAEKSDECVDLSTLSRMHERLPAAHLSLKPSRRAVCVHELRSMPSV